MQVYANPHRGAARLHTRKRALERYGLLLQSIDLDRVELAIAWGQGQILGGAHNRNRDRMVRLTVRRRPLVFVYSQKLGFVVTCLAEDQCGGRHR